MKNKYIHYGHKSFEKSLFVEIKNKPFVKPKGGLWASRIDSEYGWKSWNEDSYFRECSDENSFVFALKENARILIIDSQEKLETLPKNETIIYDMGNYNLDFEKLKEDYDAIEVLISKDSRLYWSLYGWDCDSLLVLNKEIIELENE